VKKKRKLRFVTKGWWRGKEKQKKKKRRFSRDGTKYLEREETSKTRLEREGKGTSGATTIREFHRGGIGAHQKKILSIIAAGAKTERKSWEKLNRLG